MGHVSPGQQSPPGMQVIELSRGDGRDSEIGGTDEMTVGLLVGESADSQSQVQALTLDVHVSMTCWSSSCNSSSWIASSSLRIHEEGVKSEFALTVKITFQTFF